MLGKLNKDTKHGVVIQLILINRAIQLSENNDSRALHPVDPESIKFI